MTYIDARCNELSCQMQQALMKNIGSNNGGANWNNYLQQAEPQTSEMPGASSHDASPPANSLYILGPKPTCLSTRPAMVALEHMIPPPSFLSPRSLNPKPTPRGQSIGLSVKGIVGASAKGAEIAGGPSVRRQRAFPEHSLRDLTREFRCYVVLL